MAGIQSPTRNRAVSPVLGVIILVLITLLISIAIAPTIYNVFDIKENPEGIESTFIEDSDGTVTTRITNMGTADSVTIQTAHNTYTANTTGEEYKIAPGSGQITLIAEKNGTRTVVRTYKPHWGPDSPLAANITGDTQKHPGQSYTLSATNSIGNITSYKWDLDNDGDIEAAGEEVTTSWTEPGQYPVTLTVTNSNGHTQSTTTTITNTHLIVASDGTGDYASIQTAVSNANSGWSIFVKNTGDYAERVSISKPGITLFAADYAALNGATLQSTSTTEAGLKLNATDITIRGLRIQNFAGSPALNTTANTDGTLIDNVYIDESGNSSGVGAITIEPGASTTRIQNSRILSNHGACGVSIGTDESSGTGPDGVTIENTAIRSTERTGLCAYDSATGLTIKNSTFAYNNQTGLSIGAVPDVTIQDSRFTRNGANASTTDTAIRLNGTPAAILSDLILIDNHDTGLTATGDTNELSVTNLTSAQNDGRGIHVNNASNTTFKHLSVTFNALNGIHVAGSTTNLTIQDSQLAANNQSGFYADSPATDITLTNTSSRLNTEHGLVINHADNIRIEDGNFTRNGGVQGEYHGVYVEGDASDAATDVVIRYSHLYNTTQDEEDIVVNQSVSVDARYNWWGSSNQPSTDQYNGSVEYAPVCEYENCSTQR